MNILKVIPSVCHKGGKKTALTVLFAFSLSIYGQTTNIPDNSFELALTVLGIDTNGMNGNILNSDAESVINLNVGNWGISDLTGIEAFINLKKLQCYDNSLTTLDLQSNPSLEELQVNGNNLTSLNLSNNQSLTVLNLSGNNTLASLDLTANTNLIGLGLDDTALNSIDLSNNTLLEELHINNCQLSNIDVSNNSVLTYLGCSLNNINTLDVSSNLALEFLGCYSNNLTQLNLSSNTALKQVFCADNALTTINLGANNVLKTLACNSNNLSEIILSGTTFLEYLEVSNNNISMLDISQNIRLTHIIANGNNISTLDTTFAEDLMMLNLIDNEITALNLSNNPLLKYVLVSQNNLQYIDIRNGANEIVQIFDASQNLNLTCIFVDNSADTLLSTWIVDDVTIFLDSEAACQTLSIGKNEIADVTFFPNPAKDHLTVNTNGDKVLFKLYTANGSLVLEQTLNQHYNNIALPSLQSGMYLASITNNLQSLTKKLVIR
ncbi:T9SS type A sorting domain-containing protein [Mangrovimonas aestuarii]|uniref:T9SS type A sorting domain-containing protein n=1 Tax=Mangrovimonas aestuarii TaxID=3018443 RepID=UPI002378BA0F|nr:T9SS type A sorting domain-containing protein [Mangrovimonas aestuarii]